MRYQPLELGLPGKPECPDEYSEESTLLCPGAKRLLLQIQTANLFVQLGTMPHGKGSDIGSVQWQPEEPFLPLVASLAREFDAVRVRNWEAGKEAAVFVSVG